jgi:hypothetical protein
MARQPTELQRENGFFTVSPMNFLETARTEVSAKMADEFSNEQEKILGDESIKKLDKKKLQKVNYYNYNYWGVSKINIKL